MICWRLAMLQEEHRNQISSIVFFSAGFSRLHVGLSHPLAWWAVFDHGAAPPAFCCSGYRGMGSLLLCHLPPPLLSGAASGKQDEEPPSVPSHPLRGDDHCHHPVHQPECPGLPALWDRHSGQHHTQPAQLLVSPCGQWKD